MSDEPKDEGNAEAWQSFGKRRAEEPEPAVDPSKPPIKRSQTVSLALLATAGVAALGFGELDWSQKEEDIVVYADADACIVARLRTEADCRSEYDRAKAAYPIGAPRYATLSQCESHHGSGRCVAGETVTSTSHLRIASASPMRAEVPSMTSMICSNWPSGGGPEKPAPRRQLRAAVRITSICSTVSAWACDGGFRNRTVSRTGLRGIASYRTASPNARLNTVRACFAVL